MYHPFRRPPRFGTTEWAAQRIRAIIDEEERRKAGRSGHSNLQTAQAQPFDETHADSAVAASDTSAYPQSQAHPYPPPYLAFQQTPEARRKLIDWVIAEEGGYSNDPADLGGETKYGITQDAIDDYRTRIDGSFNLSPAQITKDQAIQIYDELIKTYRLDRIADPDLRAQVIDMMVNHGIGNTGTMLLDVLEKRGYDVRSGPNDNVIGSRTLGVIRDLVNQRNDRELMRISNELVRRRKEFYADLIRKRPDQRRFQQGWLERADSFRFLPTGRQR
jgi:lysozyme family protein